MSWTLGSIAERIGGQLDGDPDRLVEGVAPITEAGPGQLSFVHNEKYVHLIDTCKAAGLVVREDLETDYRPLIRAADPYYCFTQAMELFYPTAGAPSFGVHPACQLAEDVQLGRDVAIGAGAVIGSGTIIEDEAVIWPGTVVGTACRIGRGTQLQPLTSVADRVYIGADCIIHAGCRIGDLANGHAARPCVELDDRVELGANAVIAAGRRRPTRIGRGTKVDNLLTMASDAQLGCDCLVVAQVTIGAGTTIGDRVTIAGQACLQPDLTIGNRVMIGAMSQVTCSISDGAVYSGNPARPHDETQRIKVTLTRTPRLLARVEALTAALQAD